MSQFKVGTIVALQSHPYQNSLTTVVFSGEPQLISPLMVIAEHIDDLRNLYDEKNGNVISEKGQSQCKCIWYSTKTHQFEEAWLSSKLLRVIKTEEPNTTLPEEKLKDLIGSLVILKTGDIELGKKKSYLTFKDNSDYGRTTITPLLSFVSPVMQIIQFIETKKSDFKEAIYDNKLGSQKRFFSSWAVKCKWYCPTADKMSEKILPWDSLTLIKQIEDSYLTEIQKNIHNSSYLKGNNILLQPKNLTYRNGYYYLRAYDFVKNKVKDFSLIKIETLNTISNYFTEQAPFYDPLTSVILSKEDAIIKAITNSNYIRIIYKKKNGEITTRTLNNFEIKKANNLSGVMTDYLKGYCNLRKAERLFKIKRIKNIEILDLKF